MDSPEGQRKAPRRGDGVLLDQNRLDRELRRRGLTDRSLCELAVVNPMMLSRARRGYRLRPQTVRRLGQALFSAPEMAGAVLIMAEPPRFARSLGGRASIAMPIRDTEAEP